MAEVPTEENKQLIGATEDEISITSAEMAYDKVVDLGTILDKNKCPKSNRFVLASSEYVNLMAKR